jgi:TolA-binding protein
VIHSKKALLAFSFLVLSCAPGKPPAFVEARAQAERDYANGRYELAARSWQRAADAAEHARDREEAMYRVATSRDRSGNVDAARAAYQAVISNFPNGSLAPRAAYELARFELETGNHEKALKLYVQLIEKYPESGLAGRAVDRCLVGILKDAPTEEKIRFLSGLSLLEMSETKEKVGFMRAKLLYEHERLSEAKQEFLTVAAQYPYPYGGYWDDALWYAADAERRLGKPKAALKLLARMLNEREAAHFQGSYQRSRYAEAQFRIAEIYRDDLAEPSKAMRAFRHVFTDHPTSLLRDDALWQEARIAQHLGLAAAACDAVGKLNSKLPDSRFVGCSKALCPTARVDAALPCRRYILRELESSIEKAESSDEPSSGGQSSK